MAKKALLILAKYVLGHLWRLEHKNKTVMMERKFWGPEGLDDWDEAEKIQILVLLIPDCIFFSKTLFMILHLGRFVTATAVSLMFLFLTAEAWEIGTAISPLTHL
jgi:hypothetical protein